MIAENSIYTDYRIEGAMLTARDDMNNLRVEIAPIAEIMSDYFTWHRERYAGAASRDAHVFTDLYPNNWQGAPGWCAWCDELEDYPNHIKAEYGRRTYGS